MWYSVLCLLRDPRLSRVKSGTATMCETMGSPRGRAPSGVVWPFAARLIRIEPRALTIDVCESIASYQGRPHQPHNFYLYNTVQGVCGWTRSVHTSVSRSCGSALQQEHALMIDSDFLLHALRSNTPPQMLPVSLLHLTAQSCHDTPTMHHACARCSVPSTYAASMT